jgi:hypothetical protein
MNYGLWDFKGNGWKPRPVYFAWSNLCKLTATGDLVRKCTSTSPAHVTAAMVGGVLFWVNHSDFPAAVLIEEWGRAQGDSDGEGSSQETGMVVLKVLTESTLPGPSEPGTLELTNRMAFDAPPMSFGYIRNAGDWVAPR